MKKSFLTFTLVSIFIAPLFPQENPGYLNSLKKAVPSAAKAGMFVGIGWSAAVTGYALGLGLAKAFPDQNLQLVASVGQSQMCGLALLGALAGTTAAFIAPKPIHNYTKNLSGKSLALLTVGIGIAGGLVGIAHEQMSGEFRWDMRSVCGDETFRASLALRNLISACKPAQR